MLLIEYVVFMKFFDSTPKPVKTDRNGTIVEEFAMPEVGV